MRNSYINLPLTAFIIICLLTVSNAQGQMTSEQIRDLTNRSKVIVTEQTSETIGSPFFNDEFIEGSITLQNEQTTNVLPLRYNAYENTLQFQRNNNLYAMDSQTIKEFELYLEDGLIRFVKGYNARRLAEDEFVALLSDGEAKFMVKYSVNFHGNVSGYSQATQVEEYVLAKNFYVKFGDNDVGRIRSLNERRVMRTFPSHREELEEYASQNNIQFDNVQHVARLFNYYNSLLSEP